MRPLSRQRRRLLERTARKLGERSAAAIVEHRQAAEHVSGPGLVHAQLYSVSEALAEPGLKRHAMEALFCAYATAQNAGAGDMTECYLCSRPWIDDRSPGAVAALTPSKTTGLLLLALVCGECLRERASVEARLAQVVLRDFFGGQGRQVPLAALAPGGRA